VWKRTRFALCRKSAAPTIECIDRNLTRLLAGEQWKAYHACGWSRGAQMRTMTTINWVNAGRGVKSAPMLPFPCHYSYRVAHKDGRETDRRTDESSSLYNRLTNSLFRVGAEFVTLDNTGDFTTCATYTYDFSYAAFIYGSSAMRTISRVLSSLYQCT